MQSSCNFDIDRVDRNISFDAFYQQYFDPEKPVIIDGIGVNWLARKKWNIKYLQQKLSQEPSVASHILYFIMAINTLDTDYEIPMVVRRLLDNNFTFPLIRNTRIWINSKNNVSHWHYDSNIESVFNVQIKGKKEWHIVSPETPLPCYPFSNFVLLEDDNKILNNKYHANFTLNEGDLLYLPPLWFHKIIALDQLNISINWVMTKKKTTVVSNGLERDIERYLLDDYFKTHRIAAVKYLHNKIDSLYPPYLKSTWRYDRLIETKYVPPPHFVIKRMLKELAMLGKTLLTTYRIRETFKTIDRTPALSHKTI